jgi:hypothetical protein
MRKTARIPWRILAGTGGGAAAGAVLGAKIPPKMPGDRALSTVAGALAGAIPGAIGGALWDFLHEESTPERKRIREIHKGFTERINQREDLTENQKQLLSRAALIALVRPETFAFKGQSEDKKQLLSLAMVQALEQRPGLYL